MLYSDKEIEAFIRYYLERYRQKSDDDFEYEGQVCDDYFRHCDGETALKIVIQLLEHCDNDMEIAYVAAGPLEDLIGRKDAPYDALDTAVRQQPLMRQAIQGVWHTDTNTPAGKWLKQVIDKYNLKP